MIKLPRVKDLTYREIIIDETNYSLFPRNLSRCIGRGLGAYYKT